MTFSFYQSLRTVPTDLDEVCRHFQLSPWLRFWRLEVPFAAPGLIWNTMMSMSGGWFFVVASEAITVGDTTVTLPGIGSWLAVAIEAKDIRAMLLAVATMAVVILAYDQLLFRPIVAMGEQWTAQHLLETVMISTLGPRGWAALWKPNSASRWASKGVTTALTRYDTLLGYTNSDAASLTWQNAGKLVTDGKAAFNVMGDWQDGYFSGSKAGDNLALKPGKDYGWTAVPGTAGVYDWLSDSFTLPKGAPHRAAAIQWLSFLGSRAAQDTFNPVKGSIPARKDANPKLYGPYLKWALTQWKKDTLAGSLTHGVVAPGAWATDIGTALGLYLQSKDTTKFQAALVKAAKKNS